MLVPKQPYNWRKISLLLREGNYKLSSKIKRIPISRLESRMQFKRKKIATQISLMMISVIRFSTTCKWDATLMVTPIRVIWHKLLNKNRRSNPRLLSTQLWVQSTKPLSEQMRTGSSNSSRNNQPFLMLWKLWLGLLVEDPQLIKDLALHLKARLQLVVKQLLKRKRPLVIFLRHLLFHNFTISVMESLLKLQMKMASMRSLTILGGFLLAQMIAL